MRVFKMQFYRLPYGIIKNPMYFHGFKAPTSKTSSVFCYFRRAREARPWSPRGTKGAQLLEKAIQNAKHMKPCLKNLDFWCSDPCPVRMYRGFGLFPTETSSVSSIIEVSVRMYRGFGLFSSLRKLSKTKNMGNRALKTSICL